MADLRITLDDLKNRRNLVEKRKQGRLVETPLKTTRTKRFHQGEDIDPTGSSVLGLSRLLLGISTTVTPEDMMAQYERLMTEGLAGFLFDSGGEGLIDLLPGGFTDFLSDNILAGVTPSDDVSGDPSGLLALAQSEIGSIEASNNLNKYAFHVGHVQKRPWAMTFISYLFKSLEIGDSVAANASVSKAFVAAQKTQRFGSTPRVGAIVFYAFPTSDRDVPEHKRVNHVGVVQIVEDGGERFVAIEGNTWESESGGPQQDGDGVFPRVRQTDSDVVVGFYYPDYRSREEQAEALRRNAQSSGDADSGAGSFSESSGTLSEEGFINPLDTMDKSSGFGLRGSPGGVGSTNHKGLDLRIPQGSPVYAAKAGEVTLARSQIGGGGYGNYVIIDHGNGLETRYAHLSRFQVSVGDQVSQGAVIALSGGTPGTIGAGSSTGAHLHFEVRVNGTAQNPENYLDY